MSDQQKSAIDIMAEELVEKIGPKLLAYFRSTGAIARDELMSVKEVAKELRLGDTTVRLLVASGALHRAPDISDIRIRRSVVDAYGKPKPETKKR